MTSVRYLLTLQKTKTVLTNRPQKKFQYLPTKSPQTSPVNCDKSIRIYCVNIAAVLFKRRANRKRLYTLALGKAHFDSGSRGGGKSRFLGHRRRSRMLPPPPTDDTRAVYRSPTLSRVRHVLYPRAAVTKRRTRQDQFHTYARARRLCLTAQHPFDEQTVLGRYPATNTGVPSLCGIHGRDGPKAQVASVTVRLAANLFAKPWWVIRHIERTYVCACVFYAVISQKFSPTHA